jgi:predicted SnoaL-like aldol condensation-catalyzing enzyme
MGELQEWVMQLCHSTSVAAALLSLLFSLNAWASPAEACSEPNEIMVAEYYDLAINQKDFAAASKYMGEVYIQHNPAAADGPEGLEQFIGYLRENLPDYHSEIKRCFSDGDFVILHVHNKPTPDSVGKAIVDIFRLEDGKVVEHWDVIQEIPADPKNANTMF